MVAVGSDRSDGSMTRYSSQARLPRTRNSQWPCNVTSGSVTGPLNWRVTGAGFSPSLVPHRSTAPPDRATRTGTRTGACNPPDASRATGMVTSPRCVEYAQGSRYSTLILYSRPYGDDHTGVLSPDWYTTSRYRSSPVAGSARITREV